MFRRLINHLQVTQTTVEIHVWRIVTPYVNFTNSLITDLINWHHHGKKKLLIKFSSELHNLTTCLSKIHFNIILVSFSWNEQRFKTFHRLYETARVRNVCLSVVRLSNWFYEAEPWEADSSSTGPQILRLFCSPRDQYCLKKTPLDPNPNHSNPVHTLTPCLRFILILSSHLRLRLFLSAFLTKILWVHFITSTLRVIRPAHPPVTFFLSTLYLNLCFLFPLGRQIKFHTYIR
jgi:hypothetical protein